MDRRSSGANAKPSLSVRKYALRSFSGTASIDFSRYLPCRAVVSASSSTSVAKIFTRSRNAVGPMCSDRSIPIEYASSPDALPAHHTRIAACSSLADTIRGTISLAR
jgi:hypothetical protein